MSDVEKLTFLARSIWPNGFWCDHCAYKYDYPWMFVDRCKNGWRAQCPNCATQISLTDDRIRLLMRAGNEAMHRTFLVCQVWGVSLLDILKKPTKHSSCQKPPKIRVCASARRAMMRELSDIMLQQEMSKVFSVTNNDVRLVVSAKPAFNNVWKLAIQQREEARLKREQRRQRDAERRGSGAGRH